MTVHFHSAGRTDTGKVRRRNEDSILVRDEVGLWVVADGMGGHAAGDYASSMIVERLAAVPRDGNVFRFIEAIEDTLAEVNTDLRHAAEQRGSDIIGSTVVMLVHEKAFMLCGWVGDSRAYCYADGRLEQITRDHVHGLEAAGGHGDAGFAPAPGAAALTRAVGAEASLFVDWVVAGNQPGTQFVLCSDGVNKELSDTEIGAICGARTTPEAVLDEIFDTAFARAARDNVSAVVVSLGN